MRRTTLLVVLAVVLAGCASGRDTPPVAPPTGDEPCTLRYDAAPGDIQFIELPDRWKSLELVLNETPGIVGLGSRHHTVTMSLSDNFPDGEGRSPAMPIVANLHGFEAARGDAVILVRLADDSEVVYESTRPIHFSDSRPNIIDLRHFRLLDDPAQYPHWWRPPNLVLEGQ